MCKALIHLLCSSCLLLPCYIILMIHADDTIATLMETIHYRKLRIPYQDTMKHPLFSANEMLSGNPWAKVEKKTSKIILNIACTQRLACNMPAAGDWLALTHVQIKVKFFHSRLLNESFPCKQSMQHACKFNPCFKSNQGVDLVSMHLGQWSFIAQRFLMLFVAFWRF